MRSILIVDDEPNVSRVTRLCLERAGYEVEIAPDGIEALERLRWREFDALLTDIMMPRMTGRELCKLVREQMAERDMPIFVMSSSIEPEHREWAARLGNTVFIEKPVSLKSLVQELGAVLAAADETAKEQM